MKSDHCYMCDEFQRMLDESESTIASQQAALNEIKQVLSGVLEQRPILEEDRSDLEHALDLAKADGGDVEGKV